MAEHAEALREGLMKLLGNKSNCTMIEVNDDGANSDLIHVSIKTRNPELIELLQEIKSED
jgi:hypothetical protein